MSDHNPTTAQSNLVPVSTGPEEEAGGECQGTAEALLLSLTVVWLLTLEEQKAEEGPEGFSFNQESRY